MLSRARRASGPCYCSEGDVLYLLFVDESGTHGGDHPFVLGGLAIHEDDTSNLQRELDQLVISHLDVVPLNLDEFEIHAAEMRNAKKNQMTTKKSSILGRLPPTTSPPTTGRHVRSHLFLQASKRVLTSCTFWSSC
ncbi:MAG: DUF3800 domain-containing protein [Pseudonocardiaceae bacterium]